MLPKEAGYVLSIDPASNTAGVSLWKDGELITTTELKSTSTKDSMGKRLRDQVDQLNTFLDALLPSGVLIKTVVLENVKSKLVMLVIGAYLSSPYIDANISPSKSFVSPSSWKKYAQLRGGKGDFTKIKGVKALKEIGFPTDKYNITSDDIADSVLIYLTWRTQK